MSDKKTFREAFSTAKKSGKEKFSWNGKSYSTKTAEEDAKKLSQKELESKSNKTYEKAKSSPSKSNKEISESYTREKQYRKGDEMEKKGLNPRKYSNRMKSKIRGGAYAKKRPSRLK